MAIGKRNIVELECDGIFLRQKIPARLTGECIQHQRFVKYFRQFHDNVLRVKGQGAASLGNVDITGNAAERWQPSGFLSYPNW